MKGSDVNFGFTVNKVKINRVLSIKLIDLYAIMDPRPYHFDYRRPRPNNPTFQSNHLHDSMYQLERTLTKSIVNPEYNRPSLKPQPESATLKRAHSTDLQATKITQKQTSSGMSSSSSYASVQKFGRAMAGYGRNVLGVNPSQRYQIFQKQAHNYDIISYSPKAVRPTLRKFPKLTLEDKLIEFGLYPHKQE